MRVPRGFVFLSIFAFSLLASAAQQTPSTSSTTSSPQAIQLLQRATLALGSATPPSDVTLTGTVRSIAGSSEIYNSSGDSPAGTWSGSDGVSHPISFHNLLTDPAWFFPAFPITHGLSSGYGATYVGHETREGQAVEHLTISQSPAVQTPSGAPTLAHLSQMDFFLDSTTFLPVAVTFNIHPDNNALLDIPIEVRFSDYRSVNDVQVPFHVAKYLNNGLILDLQFQTVTLNSGLTATSFSL